MNTVSDRVVRHSLAYLFVRKCFEGYVPYYEKIWSKLANAVQKLRFAITIARSASAVTPSEIV